ncbi:uncharacterized protein EV420DRAFT_1650070 [Desarmillaria tabescens]|uniref:Uncharacterized protein n=1 Tax=Armillaria tabescens TaxID=1929756 RepID=A0AA39JEW2_ARMTA|nr:uncharacterized protein EV420DRAFT_1650070 [Desarmillaria tabescens]KAK0441472.1 hypothetical protein EV420DRAFT_1650070 [Desarmillaria tabescens]
MTKTRAKNGSKKGTGNVRSTEPQDNVEELPRINLTTSRPLKATMEAKKPTLTFKTVLATDSENIWEGEVVQDGELDGKYSIEDNDMETVPYDPKAIIGSRQPSIEQHAEGKGTPIPQLDVPVSSSALYNGGYVPINGFCPNPAFGSIHNSPVTQKTPIPVPSDSPNWWKLATSPTTTVWTDDEMSDGDHINEQVKVPEHNMATTESVPGSPSIQKQMPIPLPEGDNAEVDALEAKRAVEEFIKDPAKLQHIPKEDKNDELLDSFDQRQFGGIIHLPVMPLQNGSYPACMLERRSMANILNGVRPGGENEGKNDKALNSVQQAQLFVEWRT